MWKTPRLLLEESLRCLYGSIDRLSLEERVGWRNVDPCQNFDNPYQREAHERLRYIGISVLHEYEDISQSSTTIAHNKFRRACTSIFLRQINAIIALNNYKLLTEIRITAMGIDRHPSLPPIEILIWITLILLFLAGSEEQILVGTFHNVPAWKRLTKPFQSQRDILNAMSRYIGNMNLLAMPAISQEDVFLIPEPGEMTKNEILTNPYKTLPRRNIVPILEEAYNNQRYIVDPGGAYVRLRDLPYFWAITLKVKPGIDDPHYVDFLARFDFCDGTSDFHFLNGDLAMNLGQPFNDIRETIESFGMPDLHLTPFEFESSFFDFLIALIYRDLVIEREIRVVSCDRDTTTRTSRTSSPADIDPSELEQSKPWVYIPRVVRRVETAPRKTTDNPREIEPHKVTGYIRRANMTDEHREEIRRFEAETGLEILRFVPEGHTFVRPHISPKADAASLQQLPRFIRARIQNDLRNLMNP